jgi:hypothetical protein
MERWVVGGQHLGHGVALGGGEVGGGHGKGRKHRWDSSVSHAEFSLVYGEVTHADHSVVHGDGTPSLQRPLNVRQYLL